jgi:hypothetical protein
MPTTTSTRDRRHRLPVSLIAGMCVVAIAGCGSSGPKLRASSNAGSFLAFSECMRSHGVPGFPDPTAHGGIDIAGTGVNPSSPAVRAAQATCKKVLPGGGPPAHASEQQKQHLVAISACMRRHGVPDFPDPMTTSLPSDPQDYSIVDGIGDVFLLVPKTNNVNSPAFEQAAKTCDFH